jgi:hypothetical protein
MYSCHHKCTCVENTPLSAIPVPNDVDNSNHISEASYNLIKNENSLLRRKIKEYQKELIYVYNTVVSTPTPISRTRSIINPAN